ncbi:MAG: immune inhibitor A [Flavobacteriaceae bacterium]|nr:immune inhibitor A [Flavobacteriaceae bacterium]
MQFKLFLITLFLVSSSLFSQDKEQKYMQAKIYYSNTDDLKLLISKGVNIDHGNKKVNVFIESVFSEYEINLARNLGYRVKVTIDDMKKHIANRKESVNQKKTASCGGGSNTYNTPENFNLGSMGGFLTLDQMLQELDDMQNLFPNLITVKSPIGNFTTFEGRSIHWVKISDNPTIDEDEPEMLFTAIHHAREPASMQQLIFYMWYLLENYATNNEIKAIVDHTEQFFIPIINVDGYRHNQTTNPNGGGFWRKNRRNNGDGSFGVDNNRNYSYHWGELGASPDPFSDVYHGVSSFSETENQAIKWFTEQHHFEICLNNHTHGGWLLYPFGWDFDQPTPDDDYYQAISSIMVSDNGYTNTLASSLYAVGGDSDDWMYGDTSTKNKIFSFTPEVGFSFWPLESNIIPICKSMMLHNLTAAKLITNYADLKDISDSFVNSLTGNFEYTIKRLGLQEPANFTVSIIPISTNLINVGTTNNHNNMNVLQELTGDFSFVLDSAIQIGDEIVYKLVLNNGLFDSEEIITKIYGSPTLTFTDNGNALTNYNTTNWNVTTSDYHSASSSITDSPFGDYDNFENSSIELTDAIDLSNTVTAQVSFYTKWDIEPDWDYVQFEISADNGTTWTPQCGKLTKTGNQNQGIDGEPMYSGSQNDWVQEEIDLNDYLGQQIKFRFQLVSDGGQTKDGFYFDDFKIRTISNNVASIEDNELLSIAIYPNPPNDVLTIEIPNLVEKTTISAYSINGQLLKQITTINQNSTLDLSNFSNGIYFINIQTSKSTKSFKIIKQ